MVWSSFSFRFSPAYRMAAMPFGVCPGSCMVIVGRDRLHVRFGPWVVRTALANITSTELTGPFGFLRSAGPARLSLADRGLTLATNSRHGLCLRFEEPVRGIEPTGLLRHPGLTVTVADCAGLREALNPTGA